MNVGRGTVRAYLKGLQGISLVSGATEHTYREPLVKFLVAASKDLGLGEVGVHGELRLATVGQPDLQVVNVAGSPIGYGETKVPGSATDFAKTLESEQVARYRASIQNLLVTDFIHFALFRADVGRLDVTLIETPGGLATGSHAVSEPVLLQFSQVLSAFFSASAPSATSAEQLADGLARRATLLRDAIRTLIGSTTKTDGEPLRVSVNGTQAFTGIPNDAWTWGEGFRPLEHFLDDRRGRRLDTDQIRAYQSAIQAVRDCIRLGPALDAALDEVLANPVQFTGTEAKD